MTVTDTPKPAPPPNNPFNNTSSAPGGKVDYNPFEALNIAEGYDERPGDVPDGLYITRITDVKVGPNKNGDKYMVTIEYTVAMEGNKYDGDSHTEWLNFPVKDNPDELTRGEQWQMHNLKMRLSSLGIPPQHMASIWVDASPLIGTMCIIQIMTQKDAKDPGNTEKHFKKIAKLELYQGDSVELQSQAPPF